MKKSDDQNYTYETENKEFVGLVRAVGPHIYLKTLSLHDCETDKERLALQLFCRSNQVRLSSDEAIEIGKELIALGEDVKKNPHIR